MNPLLSEDPPSGTELIVYVDDLALRISGENHAELVRRGNELLERGQTKSQTHWLKGSLSKPLVFRLGETKIKPTTEAKYLGITFDEKGKFSDDLAEKANTNSPKPNGV